VSNLAGAIALAGITIIAFAADPESMAGGRDVSARQLITDRRALVERVVRAYRKGAAEYA
jgi:hypothetical protein